MHDPLLPFLRGWRWRWSGSPGMGQMGDGVSHLQFKAELKPRSAPVSHGPHPAPQHQHPARSEVQCPVVQVGGWSSWVRQVQVQVLRAAAAAVRARLWPVAAGALWVYPRPCE
jgi:hypothetical protein